MMFLGKPSESGSARLGHIPMQFHFEKLLHRKTFYLPVARILYLKRENHCNDILHFVEIYDILVTSNKQSDSR